MVLRHKFSAQSLADSFNSRFRRGEASDDAPLDIQLVIDPEDVYGNPYNETPLPPSETLPFGNPSFTNKPQLETPLSDPLLTTPHAMLFHAVNKFPRNRCLAYRKIVGYDKVVLKSRRGMEVRDGLLVNDGVVEKETVIIGEWEYLTYQEVGRVVLALATALGSLVRGGGSIHMYAKNSASWFMLSHAASLCEISLATVYAKFGQSTLTETLMQCNSSVIFIDSDLLPLLLGSLVACPSVKTVIYNLASTVDRDLDTIDWQIRALRSLVNPEVLIISFDDFVDLGESRLPLESSVYIKNAHRRAPKQGIKDKIWGVMYPLADTSHTPKGVAVTNGNIMAGVASVHNLLKSSIQRGDTYLSYLPLCFMLEYTLVNAFLLFGLTIGFGTKTITYLLPSPYSQVHESSRGDIESFAPSILFGIPPWWDEVHGYVLDLVKENSPEWQDNFWRSVAWKTEALAHPGIIGAATAAGIDRMGMIKCMRERFFGTRVRWVGVSCAMEAAEKKEFLGAVMSSSGKMVEGYSFMEMSTIVTFMSPSHHRANILGAPLPSLEMKLVSVGSRYNATSDPPRGEIYVRGPSVPHMGYYQDREASISASLDGGWIKTGAIGVWNSKKSGLRIVDNIKPLSERFMGEHIPVEVLERKYALSDIVAECCLFYSGRKAQPVAVITVCEMPLRKLINKQLPLQTPKMFLDEILLSLPVKKIVLRELNHHGRRQGLVDFELLGGVILVENALPKVHRPHAAVKGRRSHNGWIRMAELDDVDKEEERDRVAVRSLYGAEIEVGLGILSKLSGNGKLTKRSMNFYKRVLEARAEQTQ